MDALKEYEKRDAIGQKIATQHLKGRGIILTVKLVSKVEDQLTICPQTFYTNAHKCRGRYE